MSQRYYSDQHTFADTHGPYNFKNDEDWLTDSTTVPEWETRIPEIIGIKEPLDGPWIEKFYKFISAPLGVIVWHMFCIESYNFPLRHNIKRTNKNPIKENVNHSGNVLLQNPRIREIADSSESKVLLPPGIDTTFTRLFQYRHCHALGREYLFTIRPRHQNSAYADCPVCGTRQDSGGYVEDNNGPKFEVTKTMIDNFDYLEHSKSPKMGIRFEKRDNRI